MQNALRYNCNILFWKEYVETVQVSKDLGIYLSVVMQLVSYLGNTCPLYKPTNFFMYAMENDSH